MKAALQIHSQTLKNTNNPSITIKQIFDTHTSEWGDTFSYEEHFHQKNLNDQKAKQKTEIISMTGLQLIQMYKKNARLLIPKQQQTIIIRLFFDFILNPIYQTSSPDLDNYKDLIVFCRNAILSIMKQETLNSKPNELETLTPEEGRLRFETESNWKAAIKKRYEENTNILLFRLRCLLGKENGDLNAKYHPLEKEFSKFYQALYGGSIAKLKISLEEAVRYLGSMQVKYPEQKGFNEKLIRLLQLSTSLSSLVEVLLNELVEITVSTGQVLREEALLQEKLQNEMNSFEKEEYDVPFININGVPENRKFYSYYRIVANFVKKEKLSTNKEEFNTLLEDSVEITKKIAIELNNLGDKQKVDIIRENDFFISETLKNSFSKKLAKTKPSKLKKISDVWEAVLRSTLGLKQPPKPVKEQPTSPRGKNSFLSFLTPSLSPTNGSLSTSPK